MILPKAIGGIKSILPRAKIIMSLREPIDRAVSAFIMYKSLYRKIIKNTTVSECLQIDLQRLDAAGIRGCGAHMNGSDHDQCWDDLDRAWIQYIKDTRWPKNKTEYDVCGGIVGRGLYALQLRVWWKHYNKKERDDLFLILNSKSLKPDESSGMIDLRPVTNFLGISELSVNGTEVIHSGETYVKKMNKRKNITFGRKDDPLKLSDTIREKLRLFYEPFNAELKMMLGEEWEHPWW